ncbi:MAG TPA: hypothetical protein VLA16_04560 [Ideonella sp.]|nr:hypothetical protein [Ideonella sp.]
MNEAFAYSHDSERGPFWLTLGLDQRWHPIWDGEDLGAFASPQDAVMALADGATKTPTCGAAGALGISGLLQRWRAYPSPADAKP